ncbi:MAG: hypothetical protein D3910_26325, partial [Candidatus Electrothrix sp. ATG2]|nr:hypothetical protein [Candidatus Electrothrix sp. ATG2]
YLPAFFALQPVAIMIYPFRITGTTEFALHGGDMFYFLCICCLALITMPVYWFLFAWFVLGSTGVAVFLVTAGGVMLPALPFFTF